MSTKLIFTLGHKLLFRSIGKLSIFLDVCLFIYLFILTIIFFFRELEMNSIIKAPYRVIPNWTPKTAHRYSNPRVLSINLINKLSVPNCTKLVLESCSPIASTWKSWFCNWNGRSLKAILLLPRYKQAIYVWLKECFPVLLSLLLFLFIYLFIYS